MELNCFECNKKVNSNYIVAIGKNWHSECFRCQIVS